MRCQVGRESELCDRRVKTVFAEVVRGQSLSVLVTEDGLSVPINTFFDDPLYFRVDRNEAVRTGFRLFTANKHRIPLSEM